MENIESAPSSVKEEKVVFVEWDPPPHQKKTKVEFDDDPISPISRIRFSSVKIGPRDGVMKLSRRIPVISGARWTTEVANTTVKKEAEAEDVDREVKPNRALLDLERVKADDVKPSLELPPACAAEASSEFSRMCEEIDRSQPILRRRLEKCSSEIGIIVAVWPEVNDFEVDVPQFGKSSRDAEKYRTQGNAACAAGDFRSALKFFNKWVMCAPERTSMDNDQASLAFAYANRSVVLLQQRNYAESLRDIQRAEDSGYPEMFRYKLWSRRGRAYLHIGRLEEALRCFNMVLAQVSKLSRGDSGPGLKVTLRETLGAKRDCERRLQRRESTRADFAAICVERAPGESRSIIPASKLMLSDKKRNPQFPALCSRATVEKRLGPKFGRGRGVVAEENLGVGTLVCREKPLVSLMLPSTSGSNCDFCMEPLRTPVPCSRCTMVAFCGEACRDEACAKYHFDECSVLNCLLDENVGASAHMVFRTIVKQPLETWRECLRRGENLPTFDEFEFEPPPLDSSDFATLFTLETRLERRSIEEMLRGGLIASFIVKLLVSSGYLRPSNVEKFSNTLFAGKLALRLLFAFSCNQFPIVGCRVKNGETEECTQGLAVYATASFFNHSCNPNAYCTFSGDEIVVRCIQGVQKRSQLFVDYGFRFALNARSERRTWLSKKYHFHCQCEACDEDWPMAYELSFVPEAIRCSNCEKHFTPRYANDVCPFCDTDMSPQVDLIGETTGKFLEIQDRVLAGSAVTADLLFLEVFCRFLPKIVKPPSAKANFATEVLCACYALTGNVERAEGEKSGSF